MRSLARRFNVHREPGAGTEAGACSRNVIWRYLRKPALLVLLGLSVWWLPESAEASGLRQATAARLQALGDAGATELVVSFTETPTFTARRAARQRLVIDVPNSGVKGAPPAIAKGVGRIEGVMIQAFKQERSRTTRILVTIAADSEYSVTVEGSDLRVRVAKQGSRLNVRRSSAKGAERPRGKAASQRHASTRVAMPQRLNDVRFEQRRDADMVQLLASGKLTYQLRRVSATLTRMIISNGRLPSELERTLDVNAFGGVVQQISTYRHGAHQVWIDVEHSSKARSHVENRASRVLWRFFSGAVPSSASGRAPDGKVARKTRTIFVEPGLGERLSSTPSVADVLADVSSSAGVEPGPLADYVGPRVPPQGEPEGSAQVKQTDVEQAAGFLPPVPGQTRGRYRGRRIDIDLKDADVHNVLRLFADAGRVNIVTADNVQGSITIRMRNVPWDQALDVVLRAKNLGMERRGNIIRVAPLADLEKEREMAIARKLQELKLAPLETRLIPVSYAQAADIQARARDLLSSRGSIAVDARTNVMIVRDVAGNLDQVEELTRSLDTQTPQVLIEARIVEATSRYLRDVGVQWGGDASFSSSTGNPTGLAFPSSIGLAGGASDQDTPTAGLSPFQTQVQNPNFAVNLPAAVGTGSGGALGLTFGSVDSNFNLALRLSAAETSGMLRILSSPRVLTLDNSQARISQGTLIPFSQVSAQGVQTTFQEAKLQLLVQPHVTADGSVSMRVKINRDEPDFNQTSPRGDPTILKREAETELLVMDGHTAVIGGIYTRNTGRNVNQVPFFGDIPLLGLLFQKRSASDTRGELVIFLTPRIVNRAEALGR